MELKTRNLDTNSANRESGIYVRALCVTTENPEGKWGAADILDLDNESFQVFVQEKISQNPYNAVMLMNALKGMILEE